MRAVPAVLLSAFLAGCAGHASTVTRAETTALTAAPEPPSAAADCSRRLAPRAVPRAASPLVAASEAPPSRLIVEARLPLARLTAELERAVALRLAEEPGVKIGPAGMLRYSVDRGAFSVSAAGDQLVIEAPLHARAEACSGRRCYAACEPGGLARVELPLWLRSDFRFDSSRVSLELTRGCKVRALGGLLSVDATPLLRSAIAPQLERVRREIDERLPDLRGDVERAWRQLSLPRSLPLAGCLVVAPLGLVQGPMVQSGDVLQARFALLARPELRSACSSAPEASAPLPALAADPSLPAEDVVTLGMEVPLTSLARAFESATPEAGVAVRVASAKVEARGPRITAELALLGELCGLVALDAEPAFGGDAGELTLTGGELDALDSTRVRAAGVAPARLAQQLTRLPRFPPPLSLFLLRAAPPALASLFSDPEFALRTRVSSLRAAGASARGEQLVAWVEARGSLLLEPK